MQEGIDCVAIHGTFLKDEQRIMLKKINPKRLFLGLDMDKAGNDAVIKIFNELKNEFENIYVLNFPENKDPKK
ncbi:MAG: toprim domain-containing protein, partial [Alphaproteobacteria bacterium]|nr:toprim domain-containing protein [Alphaproteobacteria bacterium]